MIDLHNHTEMCGHASGTPEEYINEAIKKGISVFGFSDHAPIPEHLRNGISMNPDETEIYIEKILMLREKYLEEIDILLGFEVDYPVFKDFDSRYFTDTRIDYLIGSCHFIDSWCVDSPESEKEYKTADINSIYKRYFEEIIKLIESRLFNIVGHVDLPKKFGYHPQNDFTDFYEAIAKSAIENNVSIEINTAGLRKPVREIYPSEKILRILIENNVSITLGSDSHLPEEVGSGFDEAVAILKKFNCKKITYFKNRIPYEHHL